MKKKSEISIASIIKSAVTDTTQANASFQSSSGIAAKIIRKAHAGCCAACAAAAGEWYYGEQPEDTFRRHGGCTCTVVYDPGNGKYRNVHKSQAWNESREAIEWRKQFAAEMPGNHLRNSLPKNYKDTRTIGETIAEKELSDFIDTANKKGIQIGVIDHPTGGFETYCGDTSVLYEVLEEAERQMYNQNIGKMILKYDNILDGGNIDTNAFAMTKGVTVTLNKFMYDDSYFLAAAYKEAAQAGILVRGTTYKNVITHELGHIKDSGAKISRRIKRILEEINPEGGVDAFISEHISEYASQMNGLYQYTELYPEVLCLSEANPESDIIKILRTEGILK